MTGRGHTMTGLALAIYPASLVFEQGLIFSFLAAFGCVLGSTAPDWLEIPMPLKNDDGNRIGTKRLIRHRTWTHVFSWWLLLAWLTTSLAVGDTLPVFDKVSFEYRYYIYSALMGFSIGGLLHLICDMPNKQKIPIFLPIDGFSLNWWKSGRREWIGAVLVQLASVYLVLEGVTPPLLSSYVG